jgi:eukaryotic-like serine/threonine-protein kinase
VPRVIAERYRLEREVGRGGMGAVWLAQDTLLQRAVAVKQVGVLPGSDKADLKRVRREARVSAMLNHPNVVGVFDLIDDDSRHWLVMEYVDGETLADRIRRKKRLRPDDLAPILAQVSDALASAHKAGIVHRDVKPSNILIGRDGTVKLGDFGIARTLTDVTLTQTGMVTGSPGYMAPEVAAGQVASPASDVWSIGATLFHGLAGTPPYDTGDNLMAALYRLVHDEPPRTERADWLEPLLRATMHRDPSGRWTAGQVASFLAAGPVTNGNPTVQIPKTSARAARTDPATAVLAPVPADPFPTAPVPVTRRRPWWPAAAAVALLIIGLVTAMSLLGNGTDPPASGNDDPTTSAPPTSQVRPTAAGMERFMRSYFSTVARDPAIAWTMLTPSFQRASGGYPAYIAWWRGLETATLESISANPTDLTVSYDVRYKWAKGQGKHKLRRDDPTLELTHSDGNYLIDYEKQ